MLSCTQSTKHRTVPAGWQEHRTGPAVPCTCPMWEQSQCRCEHMAHQTLLNTKACFVRVTSECIWWSQQTGWVQGIRNSLERPLLVLTSSAWHCYRLRGQLPLIPLPLGFLCISDFLLPQDNQQPLSQPFSRLQKQCLLQSNPKKV